MTRSILATNEVRAYRGPFDGTHHWQLIQLPLARRLEDDELEKLRVALSAAADIFFQTVVK